MAIVHVVIALALIEFIAFSMLVGWARGKYEVHAPAITGHPIFERYYRVHYNTMEQLVCFIPAVLMFGFYVSAPVAAALGLVFIVGRIIYLRGYVADPKKRGPGFMISALPNLILLLGGLTGALRAAL